MISCKDTHTHTPCRAHQTHDAGLQAHVCRMSAFVCTIVRVDETCTSGSVLGRSFDGCLRRFWMRGGRCPTSSAANDARARGDAEPLRATGDLHLGLGVRSRESRRSSEFARELLPRPLVPRDFARAGRGDSAQSAVLKVLLLSTPATDADGLSDVVGRCSAQLIRTEKTRLNSRSADTVRARMRWPTLVPRCSAAELSSAMPAAGAGTTSSL